MIFWRSFSIEAIKRSLYSRLGLVTALFIFAAFTTLTVPASVAQATAEQRIDAPFTLTVKTPHISWGNPWAGAPIHALVIPSVAEGRTLIELAERFPLTYDTVTIDTEPGVNTWTIGTGQNYQARNYKLLYSYLAADLNSNAHYDVIVLPSLFGWNRLPQEVRDAILKRVREGAGLVLVHPTTGIPAADDPKSTLPLESNSITPGYAFSPGGKLWEVSPLVGVLSDQLDSGGSLQVRPDAVTTGPWKATHPSYITDNEPFASFPADYLKHYKYHLGTDSTALVVGADGEPIVATKMYGKGRVIALGYLNYGLSPKIDWSFLGKQNDHWWEYFYSLLGRSIIWASHGEPQMTLLPMSVGHHGEKLMVPIRNATPVKQAELSVNQLDQWGDEEGTITRKVRVRKGMNRTSVDLPADFSAGQHYVDVILTADGKHYDWGAASFATPQPDKIASVVTDKKFYALGDSLQVTVHTTGEKAAGLRVELLDNRHRLIGVETEPNPQLQAGAFHATLPVGNYSTNIGWVRATLLEPDGGKQIKFDQQQTRVNFVSLDRKFGAYELILPWYGPPSYEPWVPTLEDQFRKFGVTVGAHPRDNFKIIAAVDAPGFGVYMFRKKGYIEQKDNYLRTLDTKYLIREPDLSSHAWLDKLQGHVIQAMQKEMPYRPIAYYLADESSLTAYSDPLDFSWSKPTLVSLRQWLQGRYPSLDALNQEWDTNFKSWDEVMPLTTTQAQAKGDYAAWMDHRTYMERVYAHAMGVAAGTVRSEDPAGVSSISGTQDPGPSNAINWYLLDHTVGYLQPYSMNDQDDLHRSIHAGQVMTGFTGYGSAGMELRHQLWHRLLEGQIGASLFWQYTALNADLTLTQQGRDLAALTNEFRNEGSSLLLRGAHRDNCGIAVHYSLLSLRGHWITDGHIVPHEVMVNADPTSKNLKRFHQNRTEWLQALRDANYQYDFLTTEQMDKGELSKYKVLILPDSIALSQGEVTAIRSFVERGGLLISDGETGLMDEHAHWQNGGLLDDLLGVQRKEAKSEPDENQTAKLHTRLGDQSATLDVIPVSPDLKTTTGHADATIGNTPFLIENSFGAGHSIALNFWLTNYSGLDKSNAHAGLGFVPLGNAGLQTTNAKDGFLSLLEGYLNQAGISPIANIHTTAGKPLRCSEVIGYRKGDLRYLAILPELGCADAGSISVRLPQPEYVYDLRAHRFLGHLSNATGSMDAGSPLFLAIAPAPAGKLSIGPEGKSAELRVKAGGTIEFVVHSKTSGMENFPEAVHVDVSGPDGKRIGYYSKNFSLVNGGAHFSVDTALNDSSGTWIVKVREPYTDQTGVVTFSVTQ